MMESELTRTLSFSGRKTVLDFLVFDFLFGADRTYPWAISSSKGAPSVLTCRRILTNRSQVANQHTQTRQATLSISVSIRQFRIISFWQSLANQRGQFDSTRVKKRKKFKTRGRRHIFVQPLINGQGTLSPDDTLFPYVLAEKLIQL